MANKNTHWPFRSDHRPSGGLAVAWWALSDLVYQRRVELLLITAVLVLSGAYLYVSGLTYKCTSTLCVSPQGPQLISEGNRSENYASFLSTQCELIKSSAILKPVLEDRKVQQLSIVSERQDPLEYVQNKLSVKAGDRNDIITLSLNYPNPVEASQLVNQIVQSYIDYRSTRQKSTAAEVLGILQKEKVARDNEVNDAQAKVIEFKRSNGMLTLEGDNGSMIIQRLAKLSESLTAAQMDHVQVRASYEAARVMATNGGSLRTWSQLPASPDGSDAMRQQLSQLQLQLVTLLGQCTEEHPAVCDLRARIKEAQTIVAVQENSRTGTTLAALKQSLEMADRKEKDIALAVSQQQKLAEASNVRASELAMLQSRINRAQKLSEILDSRIKELKLSEDAGAINIAVLEKARVPATASSRDIYQVMSCATVVGLLLAYGWSIWGRRLGLSLRGPLKIVRMLKLPIFGAIPVAADGWSAQRTVEQPQSPQAQAYRELGACLQNAQSSLPVKTLMVTSASAAEGKSAVAANLAMCWAQAGLKTLVIDANFDHPTGHEMFNVAPGQGLAGVLGEKVFVEQAVLKTAWQNLDILPAGPVKGGPSERFGSVQFKTMLQRISGNYDRVILDAQAAGDVDTRLAAVACDGVLVVIQEDRLPGTEVQRVVRALQSVGATVIGTVVNQAWNPQDYEGYWDLTQSNVSDSQGETKLDLIDQPTLTA